jgi:hypothetical protein
VSIGEKKSLQCLTLASGIILPAAILFSITADLPHVLLIVMLGLLISMFSRKPVKLTDRSVIYFTVLALTLTVLLDFAFPMKNDRFGYLSVFFHPEIMVPTAFYIAIAVSFFSSGPHVYGAAATAAVIALAFGGDVYNLQMESERLPVAMPLIRNFTYFYLSSIAASAFFMLLAFRQGGAVAIPQKLSKYRWRRSALVITIFVAVPLGTLGLYKLYRLYETQIRQLENMLMRAGMQRLRSSRNIVFSQEVDLNRTISPQMLKNQQQIVLRAVSKYPPGYLRGRAYAKYGKGLWLAEKDEPKMMKSRSYGGMIAFKTFYIKNAEKASFTYEILPSPKLYTKVLFCQGNIAQIDVIADRLEYNKDGIIKVEDWTKEGGYTVFTKAPQQESAWPLPEKPSLDTYTQLPENIKSDLDKILHNIPRLNNYKKRLTDRQVFNIILKYFLDNYSYKIIEQRYNGKDPAIHFMLLSRQGHCELFATSMTLLLRRKGIPARYVTGFVCEERHPSADYYVARLGNAHAWLEAFDRDRQEWVMLEPTPPSGIPNYRHEWKTMESWGDLFTKFFRQLLSDLRRGYFARAIINFAVNIYDMLKLVIWNPWRGTITLVVILFALYYYLRNRKRRKQHKTKLDVPDPGMRRLIKFYLKLRKKLAKHPEIEVSHTTTAAELVEQIRKSNILHAEQYIKLLEKYQSIRFRENAPSPEDLHSLKP